MKFTLEQALNCYDETGINILNGSDNSRDLSALKRVKLAEYQEGMKAYSAVLDKKNVILTDKVETPLGKKCMEYALPKMQEIQKIDNEIYMTNLSYLNKIKPFFDTEKKLSIEEFAVELNTLIEKINPNKKEEKNGDKPAKK
jgi:hypothetical protein